MTPDEAREALEGLELNIAIDFETADVDPDKIQARLAWPGPLPYSTLKALSELLQTEDITIDQPYAHGMIIVVKWPRETAEERAITARYPPYRSRRRNE